MKIKTNIPITKDTNKIIRKIAKFWDKTSPVWQEIWGPHIHHGYFLNDDDDQDPIVAQERLIDRLSSLLEFNSQKRFLDVGCGMGGSSIYLAKKYNLQNIIGVTLSARQVAIATKKAEQNNLSQISFHLDDAHSLVSIPSGTIDIVWSLESCEQFYNKQLFLQQAYRVLKPGGKLLIATWCSDREEYVGKLARQYRKLCLIFDTPFMPTIDYYKSIFKQQQFCIEFVDDWSFAVKKSWSLGLQRLKQYPLLKLIRFGGIKQLQFVLNLPLMNKFFQQEIIKYGIFVVRKPD